MRHQRGFAFILVLALLTVGALMIVPILSYTGTALLSQRFAEDDLSERSGVEAALEDAIWQMLYDGTALGEVNTNGEYAYNFQLGLERFPVTIEIPTVPDSEWVKLKPVWVKVEIKPNWLAALAGQSTFHYVIRISMPQAGNITEFGFVLPQGLSYDVGSTFYKGPVRERDLDPDAAVDLTPLLPAPTRVWMNNQWVNMDVGAYTTVTLEDGRERITFRPTFVATGRRILIQTI